MKEINTDLILERTEVRPTVYWYAKRLEYRLREKDKIHDGDHWHDGNLYYYLCKAAQCMDKIQKLIKVEIFSDKVLKHNMDELKEGDLHYAIKKCIDGGNFLMMLADNLRDELIKRGMQK